MSSQLRVSSIVELSSKGLLYFPNCIGSSRSRETFRVLGEFWWSRNLLLMSRIFDDIRPPMSLASFDVKEKLCSKYLCELCPLKFRRKHIFIFILLFHRVLLLAAISTLNLFYSHTYRILIFYVYDRPTQMTITWPRIDKYTKFVRRIKSKQVDC